MTNSRRLPARDILRPGLILILAALLGLSCAPGPATKLPKAAAPAAPIDTNFVHAVPLSSAKGMVVSAHPLASQVGRDVLARGGNAIDAAVATVAALNVVEPQASGLGGGGFLLYYDAAKDSFYVLDYRERAPEKLHRADYFQKSDTLHLVQRTGATSVLVPGSPLGWQTMHHRWGTMLLADLLKPAIGLADTGYPVSTKQSAMILDHILDLQADSTMSKIFLADSLPLAPGAKLKQTRLADLYKFLSRTRLENVYYPPTSTAIVKAIAARGGTISQSDLTSYRPIERKPLHGFYHGYEIITLPPPSSGGTALLEILKILEPLDLKSMGHLSPAYINTVASACRQALKDGDTWIGDPGYARVPSDSLLSDSWINIARSRIPADTVPERLAAMDSIHAFGPGNTTHLVVVDSSGNMVSLTQSINYFFGAGFMVPELGLLLNNHMGDFGLDTTSVKGIAPGHRPPSNMAPTIIRKDGKTVLVIGSPGGARIAPTLAQVLIDILDFDMPLNQALDAPRFFPAGRTLVVESRFPKETLDHLAHLKWKIYPLGAIDNYFGGVHAISINPETHERIGAADPRRDGAPAGY